jgi:hypothetical protein
MDMLPSVTSVALDLPAKSRFDHENDIQTKKYTNVTRLELNGCLIAHCVSMFPMVARLKLNYFRVN